MTVLLMNNTTVVPAAEVYVWTDEKGKKHFSDKPPELMPGSELEIKRKAYELQNLDKGFPHTDPGAGLIDSATSKRERDEKREAAARQSAQTASLCSKARSSLKIISGPVILFDDKGHEVKMTEMQRRQTEQQLRAAIKKHCG